MTIIVFRVILDCKYNKDPPPPKKKKKDVGNCSSSL